MEFKGLKRGAGESARGAQRTGRGPIAGGRGRVPKGPPAGGPGGSAAKQESHGAGRARCPSVTICRQGGMPAWKRAPGGPADPNMEKKEGGAAEGVPPPRRPRARARQIRVERRPPVSGALLSHGLTPQYHRRSAA